MNTKSEYIDVFKEVDLKTFKHAQRQGNVSALLDEELGKRVYRLQGTAANIQIPGPRSSYKGLESRKKFAYIQLRPSEGRPFFVHFDLFVFPRAGSTRISISNSYKVEKAGPGGIELPARQVTRWTVFSLDIERLVTGHFGAKANFLFKNLTFQGTLCVRAVYFGDVSFTPQNLPDSIATQLACTSNWTAVCDWIQIPEEPLASDEEPSVDDLREESKFSIRDPSFNIEDTSKKESFDKDDLSLSSYKQVSFKRGIKCEESPIKVEREAESLLGLRVILGFSGHLRSNVRWTTSSGAFQTYPEEFTQGTESYLVYPAGCTLVLMNPVTKKQHALFGHTEEIVTLELSQDSSLIITGQCAKPCVLVWELLTRREPVKIELSGMNSLSCLALSADNSTLVTACSDKRSRFILTLWDVSRIPAREGVTSRARQVSNYQVNAIRFLPGDNQRLVSCGWENVRFWSLHGDHLSGKSVILHQHARDSEYLAISFDEERVLVASSRGFIFQISPETMDIEGAFQLHDGPINSLVVTGKTCVTGSSDHYVRMWSVDFSEHLFEIYQEDGGVQSVDVSSDGQLIACGTANSSLVLLDMATNGMKILLRSHSSRVLALDVHPSSEWLLSASADRSIRLWNTMTLDETHEFTSPEDTPLSLSFHPSMNTFACGFSSGAVQIFEMHGTEALFWFVQHEGAIAKVLHSPDGRLLFSAAVDASVCVYDVFRKYQPVKTIRPELPHDYVDLSISPDSKLFAVLGTQASTIFIWEVATFALKFRINTSGALIRKVCFSPNSQDILALSAGLEFKVKFYGLNGFEAVPVKEFPALHRGADVTCLAVAPNAKYLATGATDRILKIWDYTARPPAITQQGFLGHARGISHLLFSPDCEHVFSVDESAHGLFVWHFRGDKSPLELPPEKPPAQHVMVIEEESFDAILVSVENAEKAEKAEKAVNGENGERAEMPELSSLPLEVPVVRHTKQTSVEFHKSPARLSPLPGEEKLELARVIGYNISIKDSLFWAPAKGCYFQLSGSMVVQTLLRDGNTQQFFKTPAETLTALAVTQDLSVLASAGICEGSIVIYLWNIDNAVTLRELTSHRSVIRLLKFSSHGHYLVSTDDSELIVWDWEGGRLQATVSVSRVTELYWLENILEFITLGDKLTYWRLGVSSLEQTDLKVESEFPFTAVCLQGTQLFLGASSGNLSIVDLASKHLQPDVFLLGAKITIVRACKKRVTVGGESNHLVSFVPSKASRTQDVLILDGFPNSIQMEEEGEEGLVSTSSGTLWYINWSQNTSMRIASSHLPGHNITSLSSAALIASASTDGSIRVWEPITFNELLCELTPCKCLCFHIQFPLLLAGFEDGSVRFYDVRAVKLIGKAQVFNCSVSNMMWKDRLVLTSVQGGIVELKVNDLKTLSVSVEEISTVEYPVQCLDLLGNLVLASTQNSVYVFDNDTLIDSFEVFENKVAMMNNDNCICVSEVQHDIVIRNFRNREIVADVSIPYSLTSITAIGKWLFAIGTTEGTLIVYDADTDEIQEYKGHSGEIRTLLPMSGGLLSASDYQILCWSLNN